MLEVAVSIVLVAYESREDLARCLPSIHAQGIPDLEIIVVSNGSDDGLSDWLAAEHPSVRFIQNSANTGYAGGNNLGLEHATGEWVLFLNPDTELHPGALRILLDTAAAHPNALITPKLLNPDGTVNACGLEMHYTGITTCRGLGARAEAYVGVQQVIAVSGAAFLAPRLILLELGGFDARYFMYLEDLDLSLRASEKGYSMLCASDACVSHDYDVRMAPTKLFYLERNRLLTLRRLWLGLLPALLLTETAVLAFSILRGPRFLFAFVRALMDFVRLKDDGPRSGDMVLTRKMLGHTSTALPYSQLIGKAWLSSCLDSITTPAYTLLRPKMPAR